MRPLLIVARESKNMIVKYLQIQPDSTLPNISSLKPFRAVVIIEESVTPEWQSKVSDWLVKSGCLYMMAWGNNSSTWDDSVDHANIELFNYEEIPLDQFVMTTWHEKESLKEVFYFSKHSASHSIVKISNTLLLHVAKHGKEQEFLAEYAGLN